MTTAAGISYTRQGAGEPLVLIHGVGHRRQAWTAVLEPLAANYDVIAIDLPGFGESDPLPPGTPYAMEPMLVRIRTFMAELGLVLPQVAGNSLGGAIGLELADRDLLRSVTALSPAGFWTPRQRSYAIAVLRMHHRVIGTSLPTLKRISMNPRLRAQAGRFIYAHPERIAPDVFLADALAMRDSVGLEPTLEAGRSYVCRSRPTVPTTVAWGTRDHILGFSQSRIARTRLPDARFVALVGCGHVPMYDDPAAVVRVIVETAQRATPSAPRA